MRRSAAALAEEFHTKMLLIENLKMQLAISRRALRRLAFLALPRVEERPSNPQIKLTRPHDDLRGQMATFYKIRR
jgi:hypothetical protein